MSERKGPGPGAPGMAVSAGAKDFGKAVGALWGYCKKYAPFFVAALLFAAVSAVLSVIGPDFISKLTETITDGVSPMGIHIDMDRISKIAFTLIGIYAVSMILNFLQSLIMTHISCRVGQTMRSDITKKINRIPLKYFDSHNQGDTLSRVTNDVDTITQSLEWYTLSRVDKHPKIWYIKEQKGRKKNVNLQQRIQTRSAPVVG